MTTATQERPLTLADALDHLGPLREGVLLRDEAQGLELVQCSDLVQPRVVREHVHAYADQLGTKDLVAAGSIWSKSLDAALQTPAILAMVRLGLGLDLSPSATAMAVRDGVPVALCLVSASVVALDERLPAELSVGAPRVPDQTALQQYVWRGLYGEHLTPLVEAVAQATSVQRRVLWSNIGSRAAHLLHELSMDLSCATAAQADRDALLGPAQCPWGEGRNPMHEPVRWTGLGGGDRRLTVMVRKTCCLKHRLPGRECCRTCPMLPPHKRLERELQESSA